MKTDCTNYGSQELSLWVMNDYLSYNNLMFAVKRCYTFNRYVETFVSLYYVYTDEQLENLEETYNEEIMEYHEDR